MVSWDRVASVMIAGSAYAGLALQFLDSLQLTGGKPFAALWMMFLYFTIWTNALIAVAFTAVAAGYAVAPWMLGGILLSIVLVGVIYALLLRDLPIGTLRTSALANTLVHRVTPVLVTVFWIAFVPKGHLQWRDATIWAAYPIVYLGYILLRGHVTRRYPYPFLHVEEIGWVATLRNAAGIAAFFIAASLVFIGIDGISRHSH